MGGLRSHQLIITGVASLIALGFGSVACAQTATTNSGGAMWGTQPSGVAVTGAIESAYSHLANTSNALQIQNIQRSRGSGIGGGNGGGGSISIQSIGSQNNTNQTIVNSNNVSANMNANQNAQNSGTTTTNGTVNSTSNNLN